MGWFPLIWYYNTRIEKRCKYFFWKFACFSLRRIFHTVENSFPPVENRGFACAQKRGNGKERCLWGEGKGDTVWINHLEGSSMKTVIIGGVAGGASTAARLRRLDEKAEIVLLERGPHISYANCGLPYHLGKIIPERSWLLVMTPENFRARFNVDVRVNHEVTGIDRVKKTVKVLNRQTGVETEERYDKLVVATGSSPMQLKLPGIDLPEALPLLIASVASPLTIPARQRWPDAKDRAVAA